MIFVTLGTQDKPFTRLLNTIEKSIENGIITDEVIVQAGYTKFSSSRMKVFNLIDNEQFNNYIKTSDLVITHGGVGSIITALNYDKKVIAAPRLQKYGEHVNDHQIQIIKSFEIKKYILPLYDMDNFLTVFKKLDTFIPNKYSSNNDNFIKTLERIIG